MQRHVAVKAALRVRSVSNCRIDDSFRYRWLYVACERLSCKSTPTRSEDQPIRWLVDIASAEVRKYEKVLGKTRMVELQRAVILPHMEWGSGPSSRVGT